MAYIGPEPNPGQNREVDDISSSFNGSTTAFTLQVNSQNVSPGSANAIIVSLGGVVQNPGTDYTIAASTITFTTAPASGLSFFGLVLGQGVDAVEPADGSVSTVKIADQAVTLAKLPHGTGSNDGKFLRANNGADPTFETVSGTTINNNAALRIITGSGTANTLNAESAVLIDGSGRIQQGSATDNLGAAKVNIVGGGSGINISRNQGAGASNDEVLGGIAFHGGLGSQDITTGGAVIRAEADENQSGSTAATRLMFLTKPSGTSPGSAPTERLRMASGGDVILLGSASGGGETQRVLFANSGDVLTVRTAGTNASNHGMIAFRDGNNTFCGQITSHGTNHTTSYGTSSDYRLKENEVLISDGITRLKSLKPYRFKWKSSGVTVDGFFAHEAQAVVPESVTGVKDEMQSILYKEGDEIPEGKKVGDVKEVSTTEIKPQTIDQAKLVPLLTAALQEAVAKIETLETKVAALEAA